jgi:hypothetical protein
MTSDVDAVLAVLEPAPSRLETPNATECRKALRAAYGSKRARELVNNVLRNIPWHGTLQQHRRRVMLMGSTPMRPRSSGDEHFVGPQESNGSDAARAAPGHQPG